MYINQNKSWGEVKDELVKQGLNYKDASAIVSNLKEQEHEEKKDASNKELRYGILWAGGGIALTAVTGGTLVFYGAVLWGGWLILKDIWRKIG